MELACKNWVLFALSDAYRSQGKINLSLDVTLQLIKQDCSFTQAYIRAVEDYILKEDLEKAIQVCNQGIQNLDDYIDKNTLIELKKMISHGRNFIDKSNLFFKAWIESKLNDSQLSLQCEEIALETSIEIQRYQPIQYWSQEVIPSDVQEITKSWNYVLVQCGLRPIKLWSKQEAGNWIIKNAPEFEKAFKTAPHYCSESDVFRLAFTSKHPCVYIDADMYPKDTAKQILTKAISLKKSAFFCCSFLPIFSSCFFVSTPDCSIFKIMRNQLKNIDYKSRKITIALFTNEVFGPGIFDRTIKNFSGSVTNVERTCIIEGCLDLFRSEKNAFSVINEKNFAYQVKPGGLNYKQTEDHWPNYCKNIHSEYSENKGNL
ncbi:glycosyltransferase [Synechococcus sp. MIT S1220]|uniref:glycosyltransferase n=1 Tax=Synechococcus sp. MIT S1220 TaxID=3082549 RepID=UPI0039B0452C